MRRANKTPFAGTRYGNSGFSLIELLVGLAIGMVIAIVASTIYLYSKTAYNAATETSEMEENGRFALNLVAKYIQSAGFVMVDPKGTLPEGPIDNKIFGCDLGFVNPTTTASLADLACRTATPAGELPSASIRLIAETDAYDLSSAKYQGFDCVGMGSIPTTLATGTVVNETRSYFVVTHTNVQTPNGTVRMGQLTCVSDRTLPAGTAAFQMQPLIPGVEQLRFTYLLPSLIDLNSAQRARTAAQVTSAVNASDQWPAVLAVEVCVLTKSVQPGGNDTGKTYTDCYGTALAATAGESYRTFTTTVRLRNRTSS